MDLKDIINLLGSGGEDDGGKKPSFGIDKFKFMVDKYEMTCKYAVGEKLGQTIIIEDWTSDIDKSIKLNRIYPFSMSHIELIDVEFRREVLEQVLEKCVTDENYEAAAELRDIICLL